MVILGIDPGLANVGYGVIDAGDRGTVALDWGTIQTDASMALPDRLKLIYDQVADLISKHKPGQIALERLFFNCNVKSAADVYQARGVILLAAAQANMPVIELTPQQIKMAVTGSGSATKAQMLAAVRRILKLPYLPTADTADALAVALCAG